MKGRSVRSIAISTFSAGALAIAAVAFFGNSRDTLDDVHASIVGSYPDVMHISPAEYSALEDTALLVFDTRERDEFAVSHLRGAIQVAPDLSAEDFIARYGDKAQGKIAVFYCSVGVRSSKFAEKVQAQLKAKGAIRVVNLERGLFGWHNDKRPLVTNGTGNTEAIHPYDELWGNLIERGQLTSYTP